MQDVLVLQRGHEAGLALEAHGELAVQGDARLERLDGHHPLQRLLDGLVDDGHAAAADLADDPAVSDPFQHRPAG